MLALLAALPAVAGEAPKPAAPAPAPAGTEAADASRLAAEGKSAEALALLEKALAAKPVDIPAQRVYQDLMLAAGKRAELLAVYAKMDSTEGQKWLARYLRARAEPTAEKRRSELEAIVRAEPRHFWATYDLVPLFTAAGDLKSAVRYALAARELRPNDADVRNVLGDVYIQAGQPKEAEAELNEALRLRPKFAQAHYNLGLLRAAEGKLKDAAELFARAAEEEPRFAEAWNNRGHCLSRLGDGENAIASYRKAVELKPDYGSAWNNLAVALYRKDDLWASWAALERAEKAGYPVAESFKRVLSKKLFPEKKDPAPAAPGGK